MQPRSFWTRIGSAAGDQGSVLDYQNVASSISLPLALLDGRRFGSKLLMPLVATIR